MSSHLFDIAHMLAGGLVLLSLALLYQDRMFGLLNVFALHAVVLSASVAWQGHIQDCLLYTSPSPRDRQKSRMPSSA